MQREPLQCFTGLFVLYCATLLPAHECPVRPTSRSTNIVKVFHVLNLALKKRARDCILPCLPIVSWKQFSPVVPSFYSFLSEQNIAAGYAVIKLAVLKPRTNKARATRYLNSNEARRKGNRKIGKGFGSKTGMKETGRIKGEYRFIPCGGFTEREALKCCDRMLIGGFSLQDDTGLLYTSA